MNRYDNPGTTCEGVDRTATATYVASSVRPPFAIPAQPRFCRQPPLEPANNIHLLCDTHRIDVFVETIHQRIRVFPWGHAPTQTTQPLEFRSLLMRFVDH
jgi:hypothetical protein